MDKIGPFILISVLGGLIYFGFIYDSDQGVVDDDYVTSESYQQLEEQIIKEQNAFLTDQQKVQNIIAHIIQSDNSSELELSIADTMNALIENDTAWDNLYEFRFKSMGSYWQDQTQILLALIKKPRVYDEAALVMATSQNDSLLDMQTIGRFKSTVEEKTETKIYLKAKHLIGVRVITKKLYPIEQKNIKTFFYVISETGQIVRFGN